MANMSYCKFENTYSDLRDCYESMDDELSESEQKYRDRMVQMCKNIADEYGDNDDE